MIMKYLKIWKVALIIPVALASFACSDFLTEEPEQSVSNDAYFQTIGDYRAAITGIYNQIRTRTGITVPCICLATS